MALLIACIAWGSAADAYLALVLAQMGLLAKAVERTPQPMPVVPGTFCGDDEQGWAWAGKKGANLITPRGELKRTLLSSLSKVP